MINLKQSDFCTTYSIQILVSEGKCKNDHESQKKKKKKKKTEKKLKKNKQNKNKKNDNMFYNKIPWFKQHFKNTNPCFLNLYSVHAARILDLTLLIMLSPPK